MSSMPCPRRFAAPVPFVWFVAAAASLASCSPDAERVEANEAVTVAPGGSGTARWADPRDARPAGGGLAADFAGTPTAGDVPLLVQFADQSLGSVTAWTWDFGDGDTSYVANPAHVYDSPGTYSVELTVHGGDDSDARLRTSYVTATGGGVPCPAPPTQTFTLHSDIVYGSGGCATNNAQCLDVYVPDNPRACSPTLMWIHGGGFQNGSKTDPTTFPLCNKLAQKGWYVVAANYRLSTFAACGNLSGSGSYPDAIEDVKMVVDWIHNVGTATYGLPDTVVGMGSSAGAYLVSMVAATMGPGEDFFDPFDGDFRLDRAILFSPTSNYIAVGCVGNEWTNPNCITNCPAPPNPPFDDCTVPAGCLKTGGYVPGWPCRADSGNCRDFVGAEFFIAENWPLGGDPVGVDCSDPYALPAGMTTMPTLNPWYDASTYFWISGDEPPVHLFYNECDPLAPTTGHMALAAKIDAVGVDIDALMEPALGLCDVGCQHGAFQSYGFTMASNKISDLVEAVYGD